jgi:hypothetical protein
MRNGCAGECSDPTFGNAEKQVGNGLECNNELLNTPEAAHRTPYNFIL